MKHPQNINLEGHSNQTQLDICKFIMSQLLNANKQETGCVYETLVFVTCNRPYNNQTQQQLLINIVNLASIIIMFLFF